MTTRGMFELNKTLRKPVLINKKFLLRGTFWLEDQYAIVDGLYY